MSVLVEVSSQLKPELLEQALQQLIVHHDALRLRFTRDQDIWQQINADASSSINLSVVDCSQLPEDQQPKAIEDTAEQLQTSLNLADGAIASAAFFNLGQDQPGRLLLVVHHLAIDGVSWRILLEDLATA